jgi:hypothetical protein
MAIGQSKMEEPTGAIVLDPYQPMEEPTVVDDEACNEDDVAMDEVEADTSTYAVAGTEKKKSQITRGYTTKED